MSSNKITISKRFVYALVIGLRILITLFLVTGNVSIFGAGHSSNKNGIELVAGSPEKFAMLSRLKTQDSVGST